MIRKMTSIERWSLQRLFQHCRNRKGEISRNRSTQRRRRKKRMVIAWRSRHERSGASWDNTLLRICYFFRDCIASFLPSVASFLPSVASCFFLFFFCFLGFHTLTFQTAALVQFHSLSFSSTLIWSPFLHVDENREGYFSSSLVLFASRSQSSSLCSIEHHSKKPSNGLCVHTRKGEE